MPSSIEDRNAFVAKATEFNAERRRLAAEYVAGLSDDDLATHCRTYLSSTEKAKVHPLTGREEPEHLPGTRRFELLRLWRHIWETAGRPGEPEAMRAWRCYE